MNLDRRTVLNWALGTAAYVGLGCPAWARQGSSLPRPLQVGDTPLSLVAAPAEGQLRQWGLNGTVPSPTITTRTGQSVVIELRNDLPESTILHWHGLDVPETADGHPRLAIAPGETYRYAFTVADRAGTYWYHPHPDGRTGFQTYRGMAGFLLVADDEEAELGLPDGQFELPLLLQDKKVDEDGVPLFSMSGPEQMTGFLGDRAFANGVERPVVEVERTRYRLRLLNGCNARILQLSVSPLSLTVIGTDGGLLQAPVSVDRAWLGNGERLDVLVDFSALPAGARVMLRSEAFQIPGMMMTGPPPGRGPMRGRGRGMGRGMGGMAGRTAQGTAMDFVEFVVSDSAARPGVPLPAQFASLDQPAVDDAPGREFHFDSRMHQHTINGRRFEMERVDLEIPLGQTEVWTFINDGGFPHPVHVHAGQFRVLSRLGGRNRLEPWETGLKDTVLVLPGERVNVAVRFSRHKGLFLLHCHNLEHEDNGMMLNFAVT